MEKLIIQTLMAMLLGAVIGLKGEMDRKTDGEQRILGGFRTHTFLALLGGVSGIFFLKQGSLFSVLLTGTIMLMIVGYYINGAVNKNAYGITSEITAVFAHFVGILVLIEPVPMKYIIAITILTVFIITRRSEIRGISQKITRQEIIELSMFAIIALVILPYLPNHAYSLRDIIGLSQNIQNVSLNKLLDIDLINPFVTWSIVVFISGIDLLGHVLVRIFSNASSRFITSLIGGFVSSTSMTISLAHRSKKENSEIEINQLVSATLASNASSYLQILIIVLPISFVLFQKIFLATIVLIISSLIFALVLELVTKNKKQEHQHQILTKEDPVFKLVPAIKFAFLLTFVGLLVRITLLFLGSSGFLFTASLAAVTGVDAILISLAGIVSKGQIGIGLAFTAYLLVLLVNMLSKIGYSYLNGTRQFTRKLMLYQLIIFFIALLAALLSII
ncbi:MAG: DUF4010 domain-containing protein [bacterium]